MRIIYYMLMLLAPIACSRILIENAWSEKIKSNACSEYIQLFPEYTCVQESNIGIRVNTPIYVIKDNHEKLFALKISIKDRHSDQEVEVLKKIKDRKFLAQMKEEKVHDDLQFIVLEYAAKQNLESVLQTSDYFSNTHNILIFFTKLIVGLTELHKAGFIHSKLGINNVVLNENFDPLIIDFNFAQPINSQSYYKGIPIYMTPELVQRMNLNREVIFDEKMDVYSAGVILYYMKYYRYPIVNFEMEYSQMINMPVIFEEGTSSLLMNTIKQCIQLSENRSTTVDLNTFLQDKLKNYENIPILQNYYYTMQENQLHVYRKTIYEMNKWVLFMLVASGIILSLSLMFCYCQLCLFLMWSNMDVNRVSLPPSQTNIEKRFMDSVVMNDAQND